jgi:hypothetical protein
VNLEGFNSRSEGKQIIKISIPEVREKNRKNRQISIFAFQCIAKNT